MEGERESEKERKSWMVFTTGSAHCRSQRVWPGAMDNEGATSPAFEVALERPTNCRKDKRFSDALQLCWYNRYLQFIHSKYMPVSCTWSICTKALPAISHYIGHIMVITRQGGVVLFRFVFQHSATQRCIMEV